MLNLNVQPYIEIELRSASPFVRYKAPPLIALQFVNNALHIEHEC